MQKPEFVTEKMLDFLDKMKVQKIKVGDIVRIRDDLVAGERYGKIIFLGGFWGIALGKTGVVVDITPINNLEIKVQGIPYNYLYSPEMLEGVVK